MSLESSTSARDARWHHGLLLAVQCAALVIVGRETPFDWGFPLDDAWIHQVVAREFARSGHLGFVPDRFASASTSVLFSFVQAWNHVLLGLAPALYAFVVNALLFVGTGQLVLWMARRDGLAPVTAFGFAAFASLSGNFVWFVYSGMEATLFVFLSVATLACWLHPRRSDPRSAAATGVLLGLLFLTRPEAGVLGALLAALAPVARRRVVDLAWLTLPFALIALGYFEATQLGAGHAGPSTLEGRRWMWTQTIQGASTLQLAEVLTLNWIKRLAEYSLGTQSPLCFWTFAGLVLLGLAACVRRRGSPDPRGEEERCSSAGRPAWFLCALVGWAGLHLATYAVLMPAEGHGGRYQPLIPMLFLPLGWLGLAGLMEAAVADTRARALATGAATLLLCLPLVRCLDDWAGAHRLAVQHVHDTEIAMGEYLRGLPEDARVASFDIGGIGYFADRPLIDLGGLADPAVIDVIREGRLWDYLRQREVEYLVVPLGYNPEFPDPWNFWDRLGLDHPAAGRVSLVHAVASPLEVWEVGLKATLHCAPQQYLYRVDYADADADTTAEPALAAAPREAR